MIGIVVAVIAVIILLFTRSLDPLKLTGFMYAIVAVLLTRPRYWEGCFGYSRVFTPLLLVIALDAGAWKSGTRRRWWVLVPVLLIDLRIGLQLGPQMLGILQGIAGR